MGNSSISILRQVVDAVDSAQTTSRPRENSTASPDAAPKSSASHPDQGSKPLPGHAGHLKILVENAPIAMAMFDSQMCYLLANRRWMEDFKLQNQDVIGKSQYEVFPTLHPGWRHVYERALQGQVVRSDRDSVTRDGQRMVYRWEVRPWRNMDTAISGVMITCERLSAGAQASAAPAPVEAPQGTTAPPESFWKSTLPIVTLDPEGRVLKASAGAVEIFLSAGLQQGRTPLWQIYGDMQPQGPTQNQIVAAIQLALRKQGSQVPLSLSAAALENAPVYWQLSAVNGSEWGANSPVVLAIGMPSTMTPAQPVNQSSETDAGEPALREGPAVQAFIDSAAHQQLAEEVARLRMSVKEACDNDLVSRHREARLRSVLDVLPVGLLVLDERGRPIYHNAQLAILLGRPILEGQTVESWLALCCRDERHTDEVIRQWREGVWRKQAARTIALAAADGLVKDIELTPAQLTPGGFVVAFRDVTELRRLDEMLRSTEAKLRTLVLESPIPIILSDRAGGVFDANPAAEDLLGYSRGELRRMPMDLWLKPDSFAARSTILREMAQRGDRSAEVQVELQSAAGRTLYAKMRMAVVPDAFGAPLFTIHYLEWQRPVEPAIRPDDTVVHRNYPRRPGSLEPLLTTDANGRIASWSEAAEHLFGHGQQESLGRGLHTLFRPSDPTGFYHELQQLAATEGQQTVEWKYFPKVGGSAQDSFSLQGVEGDGRLAIHLCHGVPDETPAQASFLIEDDEQPAAEVEGSHTASPLPDPLRPAAPSPADLTRERLLIGETHHRVKNHLQIITSMLNLQMSTVHNEEAKDALRSSQNRVRSIAALHQHLYQLASGETSNFPQFATGLIEHLRECYAADPGRVVIDLNLSDAQMPEEWLMPLALALNEMVSNALKHAFPGERIGRLQVDLAWGEERAELAVEDDGVGLPEEFDGLQSTGLGLKILRVFAGQLGGEIVVNRSPGEGARFTLRFPLTPSAGPADVGNP